MACGQIPGPSLLHPSDFGEGFLKHFGFREQPFGVTPDPSYLFYSEMHRSALRLLANSIECNLGFAVLLGAPGMGKTSLLLKLLTQYRTSARTAFIFQTQCSPRDLLRHLASEFEIPSTNNDEVLLHQRLKEMLVNEARAGRKVLVMIDEAQNLQDSSLEAIRLLSDFETRQAKLLHIILAGSARLSETLMAPELSQLAQRISTVCRLAPLSPEEVAAYITFRLERAGYNAGKDLFSPEALSAVAEQSGGVPRVVNSLCLGALSLTYSLDTNIVAENMVRQAARNLDLSSPSSWNENQHKSDPYSGRSAAKSKAAPFGAEVLPWFYGSAPERDTEFEAAGGTDTAPPTRNSDRRDAQVSLHPNSNTIPIAQPRQVAQPRQARSSGAGKVARVSVPYTAVRVTHNIKNNSFLILAIALILAIVWAGWYQFRARTATSGLYSTNLKQPNGAAGQTLQSASTGPEMTTSNTQASTSVERQLSIAPATSTPLNSSGTVVRREIVELLPQPSVPSRLSRRTDDAPDPGLPAKPLVVGGSAGLKSLAAPPSSTLPAPPPSVSRVTDEPVDTTQSLLGKPIKVVRPDYPKFAMLSHIEGDVVVELKVNPNGRVQNVRTISGKPILAAEAEDAAREFQFSPFTAKHLPAVTQVRFNFKLHTDDRK